MDQEWGTPTNKLVAKNKEKRRKYFHLEELRSSVPSCLDTSLQFLCPANIDVHQKLCSEFLGLHLTLVCILDSFCSVASVFLGKQPLDLLDLQLLWILLTMILQFAIVYSPAFGHVSLPITFFCIIISIFSVLFLQKNPDTGVNNIYFAMLS